MHLPGADQVVVVQDQHHRVLARLGGQLVDQRRHQPLKRRRRRAGQRAGSLADPRPRPVQRGHHMPPEPHRVVIASIQRQPRHRPAARPGPVGQQRRLAEPGRGTHQDQPPGQRLAERPRQPRPRHEPRPRAGHVQLGGQQDILLSRGSRRQGCRLGLSHRATYHSAHPAMTSIAARPGHSNRRAEAAPQRPGAAATLTPNAGCLRPFADPLRDRTRPEVAAGHQRPGLTDSAAR